VPVVALAERRMEPGPGRPREPHLVDGALERYRGGGPGPADPDRRGVREEAERPEWARRAQYPVHVQPRLPGGPVDHPGEAHEARGRQRVVGEQRDRAGRLAVADREPDVALDAAAELADAEHPAGLRPRVLRCRMLAQHRAVPGAVGGPDETLDGEARGRR